MGFGENTMRVWYHQCPGVVVNRKENKVVLDQMAMTQASLRLYGAHVEVQNARESE